MKDIIKLPDGSVETRIQRPAIVIGVGNYENDPPGTLDLAKDSALHVKKLLEERGGFDVRCLTDAENMIAPTKKNIEYELDSLDSALPGKFKTFVFYFIGHGGRINDENYLFPKNADDSNLKTLIKLNDIFLKIRAIKNKKVKVIVFLDACRNKMTMGDDNKWITDGSNFNDLNIIYSTLSGKPAYELPNPPYNHKESVFTKYFIESADDKNKEFINIEEIFNNVYEKMRDFSKNNPKNYQQCPILHNNMIIDDFSLIVKKAGENPIPVDPILMDKITVEIIKFLPTIFRNENDFNIFCRELDIPNVYFGDKDVRTTGIIQTLESNFLDPVRKLYEAVMRLRPNLKNEINDLFLKDGNNKTSSTNTNNINDDVEEIINKQNNLKIRQERTTEIKEYIIDKFSDPNDFDNLCSKFSLKSRNYTGDFDNKITKFLNDIERKSPKKNNYLEKLRNVLLELLGSEDFKDEVDDLFFEY